MKRYTPEQFKTKLNKIYCCDSLEALQSMPDECVNLIVTSPPYNKKSKNRKPHKSDTWSGGGAAIKYSNFDDFLPEKDYQEQQIKIINECMRVLKSDGSFFYNHKNRTVNKGIITPYE